MVFSITEEMAMQGGNKTSNKRQLDVKGIAVTVVTIHETDYISLTDMLRAKEGEFFITDWLRNRNTLEYLGIWEQLHNPDFNYGEFAAIKSQSGLNSFKVSAKEWAERTKARGIYAKAGRYGGTYAHKDIAFKFGSWISAEFELYMIKDYQRLKETESQTFQQAWDFRRFLAKVNYRIQTDAIERFLIPLSSLPKRLHSLEYAQEADILNVALFGKTAKEWREENPTLTLQGKNIRDECSLIHLTVLANMESINAALIQSGIPKLTRIEQLCTYARSQFESLLRDARLQELADQEMQHPPRLSAHFGAPPSGS